LKRIEENGKKCLVIYNVTEPRRASNLKAVIFVLPLEYDEYEDEGMLLFYAKHRFPKYHVSNNFRETEHLFKNIGAPCEYQIVNFSEAGKIPIYLDPEYWFGISSSIQNQIFDLVKRYYHNKFGMEARTSDNFYSDGYNQEDECPHKFSKYSVKTPSKITIGKFILPFEILCCCCKDINETLVLNFNFKHDYYTRDICLVPTDRRYTTERAPISDGRALQKLLEKVLDNLFQPNKDKTCSKCFLEKLNSNTTAEVCEAFNISNPGITTSSKIYLDSFTYKTEGEETTKIPEMNSYICKCGDDDDDYYDYYDDDSYSRRRRLFCDKCREIKAICNGEKGVIIKVPFDNTDSYHYRSSDGVYLLPPQEVKLLPNYLFILTTIGKNTKKLLDIVDTIFVVLSKKLLPQLAIENICNHLIHNNNDNGKTIRVLIQLENLTDKNDSNLKLANSYLEENNKYKDLYNKYKYLSILSNLTCPNW